MAASLSRWTVMPAGRRVLLGVLVFAVVGGLLTPFSPWEVSVLGAWIGAGGFFVGSVWLVLRPLTPEQTQAVATREDDSRIAAHFVLVVASIGSLAGVGIELARAGQEEGFTKFGLTALGIATVLVSWAVLHTVFALRYAHEYYSEDPGGVNFGNDAPDYHDFAYLAFTIGMTYQVSDTGISLRRIRRTVLSHALMSYLFGAVILAVTVNAVAGLVN